MKAFVVTHVEHGWDCVLAVFSTAHLAEQYVKGFCEYTETPEDVLVIHEQEYKTEPKGEDE